MKSLLAGLTAAAGGMGEQGTATGGGAEENDLAGDKQTLEERDLAPKDDEQDEESDEGGDQVKGMCQTQVELSNNLVVLMVCVLCATTAEESYFIDP